MSIVGALGGLFMLDVPVLSLWLRSIEAPPTHFTNLDTQLMNEWRNRNAPLKPTVAHAMALGA